MLPKSVCFFFQIFVAFFFSFNPSMFLHTWIRIPVRMNFWRHFLIIPCLIALWSRSAVAQSKAASNHTKKAMGCHLKFLSYRCSKGGHWELLVDFSKVFLCVRFACEPQWKVLIWAEIRTGWVRERSPRSESLVAAAFSRSWAATAGKRSVFGPLCKK